ncbi:hypothetical protein N7471_008278 [Penicillium samsonianum]|uniref:uncharacterized protein n=1 Tax=Penicillium samsonianum TaxID=1882272 RepID=UPI002548E41F|nr:uncharacterized protein N7471_008278 [Penicillium samsonianum]KAJ6133063.1 hypothetical protein N7471_008278 [Penicillium samsonianum]
MSDYAIYSPAMENCRKFIVRMRPVLEGRTSGDNIVFTIRDGEHGFDGDVRYEETWLQDSFTVAVGTWVE